MEAKIQVEKPLLALKKTVKNICPVKIRCPNHWQIHGEAFVAIDTNSTE
jgi:hypothetical protein